MVIIILRWREIKQIIRYIVIIRENRQVGYDILEYLFKNIK